MRALRCGITTGTCAAAAAKAAAMVLCGQQAPAEVAVTLPGGEAIVVGILAASLAGDGALASASVRKDAGDDADVTHGMEIRAAVAWSGSPGTTLVAGEGVGIATKPGLQVAPGQPAINPVPRQMILAAVGEVTPRGLRVEISIPGGREIACKTFNPRLGIEGGLSVLGTTGIVRPYCTRALRDALRCALDVAVACGVAAPVFVPGHIGARAAERHFSLRAEQVIEVGNEWGFVVDLPATRSRDALLIAGHPGKLAKLAQGQWDTHSARSDQATRYVADLIEEVQGRAAPESPTVEGLLAALPAGDRRRVGDELAGRIRRAVALRLAQRLPVAVFLADMAGEALGADGDLSSWQ
jgi:cobalt-precorrin-5B (C1)-methyltransferase